MDELSLHKRIAKLEAGNQELLAENKRLREMLGLPTEKYTPTKEAASASISVNKFSSPDEKIKLFQSLFRGRTDVYAKRCYSKKHDSNYYIPACKNEWARGLCDRTRVKCKDCKYRELLPLTAEVIDKHLRNKEEHGAGIVGVYPLLPDETCFFLAVDFDEEKWEKDVAAFRSVCDMLAIPIAIERSRSGNGAHAWLFFEEAVSALSARRLGNALLTKAMNVRHEIQFSSYDRMFPNQDFMPKGGFGNLIALPLQGEARKNGNSEFVDAAFREVAVPHLFICSRSPISNTLLRINGIKGNLLTFVSEERFGKSNNRQRKLCFNMRMAYCLFRRLLEKRLSELLLLLNANAIH